MKKLLLAPLFLLVVSIGGKTYADSKPVDVKGWQSAKWGMTSDEVRAVFGKNATAREPKEDAQEGVYSDIELSGLDWGGSEFRASLWMDSETKRLKKIVFVPTEKPDGFKWAEMFIKLEESLVDKYGAPDVEETSNDPGTSAERKWIFPSTLIEMSYLRIEDTELLLLVFSENDKSQD
ncbi:MAG: hypothetical protein RIG61_11605 [Deltaproteobacteria bacterium]